MKLWTYTVLIAVQVLGCSAARAESQEKMQMEMVACKPREYMARAITLIDQKDGVAADKLFSSGQLSGNCRVFYKDDRVILEEREMFGGLSKIRAPGDPTAFWTINRAVDPRR